MSFVSCLLICLLPGRSSLVFPPDFTPPPGRCSSSPPSLESSNWAGAISLYSACEEKKKTDWLIERMNVDRFYIIHVNNQEASLKSLRMIETLFLYCSDISTMTNFHTYGTLSWFSCNAPPLDSRQTLTTAHSTAGGTVRTDKHCRSSSRPQLQSACGWFGLKVLLAKMLAAEVRVGCGDPLGAGALHLLLPFAKLLSVLGEFKQCHTIFCSFAASIGHTVVGHPVLCSQEDHECLRV